MFTSRTAGWLANAGLAELMRLFGLNAHSVDEAQCARAHTTLGNKTDGRIRAGTWRVHGDISAYLYERLLQVA